MAQEVLEVPGLEYNFLEMVVQVVLEVLVALFDLPSQVVLEFQGNHRLLYHPLPGNYLKFEKFKISLREGGK